jgi:hypothetical protein
VFIIVFWTYRNGPVYHNQCGLSHIIWQRPDDGALISLGSEKCNSKEYGPAHPSRHRAPITPGASLAVDLRSAAMVHGDPYSAPCHPRLAGCESFDAVKSGR